MTPTQTGFAVIAAIFVFVLPTTSRAQLPVTADLELWLDASDIDADGSPDSIAHGATISNWQDKSGNNHDADVVQSDPAYVASGPNGKPVVGFDGNDQISLSDDLRTFITNADGSYSLITVARYSGGARNRVITVDSGHNWLFGFHGSQSTRWFADGWVQLDGPGSNETAWHVHTGLMDGAPADPQALFYRDGGLRTDITSGNGDLNGRGGNNSFNNYAPDRLALGGWNVSSEFSTCEVAEVILYDRLLSDSERMEVEEYLNCKYGLGPQVAARDDVGSTDEETVATEVDLPITAVSGFSKAADLDFSGTFPYAVNARGPGGFSIGDASFTDDAAAGVTLSSTSEILVWDSPNPVFGDTADDNNLETVMQSIRWSSAPNLVTVDLDNLVVGSTYKLQLLFLERTSNRGFDVDIEGTQVLDNFNPGAVGEIDFFPAVITHTFVAGDTTLNIELDGVSTPFPDKNPILNGLTLESLPPTAFGLLANDNTGGGMVVDSSPTSALGASVSVSPSGTFLYDPGGAPALQALGAGVTVDDTFRYTISKNTAPADLGGVTADLALWLDANDIDADGFTDALPDGSLITNWQDKSGNDRDANGVLGTPFYVESSVANRTGAPAVGFSVAGGADQLFTSYNFDNLGPNYTIFAVSRYSGGANARVVTSKTRNWLYGHHGNRDDRWFAEGWIEMGDAVTDTNMHLYSGVIGPAVNGSAADPGADFWKDGVQLEDDNQGSNNTSYKPGAIALGAWTGGGEASNCEVSEVIIYNRALSDTEREAVEEYLYAKYFGAGTSTATATIRVTGIDDPLVANNDPDYCTDEETVLNPAELAGLLELNSLNTGDYAVTADGETFEAHVDHDGTHGWLLVGRGRQGWAWNNAGAGLSDDVNDDLGTPAAFPPAYYRAAIINELVAGAGVDLTDVEIRLKRAEDTGGTVYQEVRWRPQTQTTWTWVFDAPGYTVEQEIVSGTGAGSVTTDITRDTEPPNDLRRVFTWAWGGHALQQGFSYGNVVTPGSNTPTNFLWENGNENHAIPYTEVYIRVSSAPAGTPPASLLANDSDPDNEIYVSAFDTTGTLGQVNVPTGIGAGDGSFTYDPNGMFESLNVGDTATDTFDYTVTNITSPRFVRIQNNGPVLRRMDIGEIEVFAPGVTPAVDNAGGNGALNPATDLATTANGASLHSKGAASGFSQPHGGDDDPRLIDGAETTGAGTWSSNGVGNFVIIDLGGTMDVETVRVHQRNDGCCQDRLRDFTVSLLADAGGVPGAVLQNRVFAGQPANDLFGEVSFDPPATPVSETATVTVTVKGVNDPPTITGSGIPDQCINTSSPTLDVNLFDFFEDVDNDDDEQIYTVTMNTDMGLIQTSAIPSATGVLTLTTPCDIIGSADITVEVEDTGGETVSDTFTVEVKDDVPPDIPVKDLFINAPAGGSAFADFSHIQAFDKVDGPRPVTCNPDDLSPFTVAGSPHLITCSATDLSNNTGMASFNLHVLEIQATPGSRMLDIVSIRNDPAPGAGGTEGVPANSTILLHNHAFLNNNGDVLYEASLLGAGLSNVVVYRNNTPLAVKGAPSPVAGNYGLFDHLSINDAGSAFQSRIGANAAHYAESGGPVAEGSRVGNTAPGTGGGQFSILYKPALASTGTLLSPASLRLFVAGVTIDDDTGIWDDAGTIIAREGSLSPIGGTTNHGQMKLRAVASTAGNQVAYASYLVDTPFDTDNNIALFAGTLGSETLVVRENDPAPGTGGATFDEFLGESVNSLGRVVTRNTLNLGGGVTVSNNEGLWTNAGGGPLRLVAREDAIAPCLNTNVVRFDRFATIWIGDDGSVCFHAFLRGPSTGPNLVNSTNDGSIWRLEAGSGELHLVAREGGVTHNTAGAVISLLESFTCNNTGGVVFHARLVNNTGDTLLTNNSGVWLDKGAPDVAPMLVMRRGDSLDPGGGIRNVLTIGFEVLSNTGGGTGGYGRTLNDNGEILLKMTLDGNLSGVFTLQMVP